MAYNPLNNSSVLKRTESCLRFLLAVTILTFSFLVTPCIAQPAELASETFRNDVQFDTQTTQEDQQDNSRFRTPSSTFTINPATVLFGLGILTYQQALSDKFSVSVRGYYWPIDNDEKWVGGGIGLRKYPAGHAPIGMYYEFNLDAGVYEKTEKNRDGIVNDIQQTNPIINVTIGKSLHFYEVYLEFGLGVACIIGENKYMNVNEGELGFFPSATFNVGFGF